MNFKDSADVKVVIRVRPPAANDEKQTLSLYVDPDRKYLKTLDAKIFTFDFVAGPDVSQLEMYEEVGLPIVESCMSGYNGTVFCYGQTGAGKTFTMTGTTGDRSDPNKGLIPLMLEALFKKMSDKMQENNERVSFSFDCTCSFLEIYNEKITDLLDFSKSKGDVLSLREDTREGVYVEGIVESKVKDADEAYTLLKKGLLNRHVGVTLANSESSRSHSVFTLVLRQLEKTAQGISKIKTSKLNMIDLAGSERQSQTKTEGERFNEACYINKSLTVLGQVINGLVDIANGKQRHINYRDSKLTFLLRDSLGGNSKTCIIANVSPALLCLRETMSTLQFGQRAKFIKNKPIVNEDESGSVQALQDEIKTLKLELEKWKKKNTSQSIAGSISTNNNNTTINSSSSLSSIGAGTAVIGINNNVIYEGKFDSRVLMNTEEMLKYEVVKHLCSTSEDVELQLESALKNVDLLKGLVESDSELIHHYRMMLKLKECELAKLKGLKPKLSEKDFQEATEKLDYAMQKLYDPFGSNLNCMPQARSSNSSNNNCSSVMMMNVGNGSAGSSTSSSSVHPTCTMDVGDIMPENAVASIAAVGGTHHPGLLKLAAERFQLAEELAFYQEQYAERKENEDIPKLKEMKKFCNTLKQELDLLLDRITKSGYKKELEEMEVRLRQSEKAEASLRQKVKDLEDKQLKMLKEGMVVQTLNVKNTHLQELYVQCKDDLEKQMKQTCDLERMVDEMQRIIEQKITENIEMKNAYDLELKRLSDLISMQAEQKNNIEELQSQRQMVDFLSKYKNDAEAKEETLRGQVETLQSLVEAGAANLQTLQHRLNNEEQQKKAMISELNHLGESSSQLESENRAIKHQLNSLKNGFVILQEQYNVKCLECQAMAELHSPASSNSSSNNNIVELQIQLYRLKEENQLLRSNGWSTMSKLSQQVQTLQQECKKLQNEKEMLQDLKTNRNYYDGEFQCRKDI